MDKGLIQVYTGNGKGKTTAALGLAIRAKGHGFKVGFISFFKHPEAFGYGEYKALEKLGIESFNFAKKHPHFYKDISFDEVREECLMNIYHIAYAPEAKTVHLHFWGCNMRCRGCLCQKEIYDCHLEETKDAIFDPKAKSAGKPESFLEFSEVMRILKTLDISQVIFMGMEPALDPELPRLAGTLHKEFQSANILLTNGLKLISMENIDEIVFSIKAYRDDLHRDYTGVPNRDILKNFAKLYHQGKRLRAESVFIPDYIDSSEIESIAEFISSVDKSIPYRIDAYFPAGSNPWRRPFPEEMEKARQVARKYLVNVSCLRGDEELKHNVLRVY